MGIFAQVVVGVRLVRTIYRVVNMGIFVPAVVDALLERMNYLGVSMVTGLPVAEGLFVKMICREVSMEIVAQDFLGEDLERIYLQVVKMGINPSG